MKKYSFILLLFFAITLVGQTNHYVKQGNSLSNDGLTPTTAVGITSTGSFPNDFLATIQPGGIIHLIGTFTNPSYSTIDPTLSPVHDPRFWHGENTIRINNLNGTAGNYITIKAYDSNTLLKGDGGNIFRIQNSSYLKIEGFHIQGEVDNLPLSVANALQFVYILNTAVNLSDPTSAEIKYRDQDCVSNCTAGAVIDGEVYSALNPNRVYRPTYYDTRGMYLSDVRNIDILNNHIHHMPGGGLRVSDCEDILIQGNEINDCSRRSSGGTHGLVVTKATSTRLTDDYRIKIIGNKVHHNYNEQYSWAPDKIEIVPHIDEGKGISLQRNQTVGGANPVNWENGRILIANNICYYNGFSGIHSNDGFRIDVINNTCYFNSYTGSITNYAGINPNGGNIGISLQGGTGHKVINNISIIDNNLTRSPIGTDITTAGGVFVKNNIIYGTTGSVLTDQDIDAVQISTRMINPQFINASLNNFALLAISPAINQADASYATTIPELTKDYYGNIRTTPDIGAIEYVSPLPITLLTFSGKNTEGGNLLTWSTAEAVNFSHFELERSLNAKNFEKIGRIMPKDKGSNYTSLDTEKVSEHTYYRLKMVDKDSSFEYSKTISLLYSYKKNIYKIFPNPTTGLMTLETAADTEGGIQMELLNTAGQKVLLVTQNLSAGNHFIQLDLTNLPKGMYLAKVIQNGQFSQAIKVIKY
jgi:hypothetical protein